MITRHPTAFVLTIVAEDRPGIVAAASRALNAVGGNIDACSQTVLAEYFTLIMIVSFPVEIDPDKLAEAVSAADIDRGGPGVEAHLRPYKGESIAPPVAEGENFVLTAFGADREGITCRFSTFLADKGVNISDLYGHSEGDQFILIGQVQTPKRCDIELLQAELEHMAAEIGHTVSLQHENVFVATNQIRPPTGTTGKRE